MVANHGFGGIMAGNTISSHSEIFLQNALNVQPQLK
jgi:hypothetical protein